MSKLAFFLGMGIAVVGCGSSHGGGGGGGTPVPREAFCRTFGEKVCAAWMRCGCGTVPPTCAAEQEASCMADLMGPEVEAALAAGTITYDERAAGRFVGAFDSARVCDDVFGALGWTFGDVFGFGGVYRGTADYGDACMEVVDLVSTCRAPGVCAGGRCVAIVGEGEVCDGTNFCADLSRPLDRGGIESDEFLLRCELTPGTETGICRDRLADGAACMADDECASLYCDATCQAPRAVGMPCDVNSQCASGYCADPTGTGGMCGESGLPTGAACDSNAQCESNACDGGNCVRQICEIG